MEIQEEINRKVENLRLSATSPLDVVNGVKEILIDYGINIDFSAYPANFSSHISNTPKVFEQNFLGDEDKPNGYPGWSGRWSGKSDIWFRDLINGTVTLPGGEKVKFNMYFLNTGSGGGGENFTFSGILWVHDFPKMLEEFRENGGEFSTVSKEYLRAIQNYKTKYDEEMERAVVTDPKFQELTEMMRGLEDSLGQVKNLIGKQTTRIKDAFFNNYAVEIPKPPGALFEYSDIIMKIATNPNAGAPHPNCEELLIKCNDCRQRVIDYIDQNAEFFI